MKTPFQNYILQVLQEQASPKPINNLSDFVKDKPPVDDFSDLLNKPVHDLDVPDETDGGGDAPDNTEPPIDVPDGLDVVYQDSDGDGEPDLDENGNPIISHFVDSDGNIYNLTYVYLVLNGVPSYSQLVTYTYTNQNGVSYEMAFNGERWNLIGDVNGVPTLLPGIFVVNMMGGGTPIWGYQDHLGNYWFTQGDPYGTGENEATWTNPVTGGQVGGDGSGQVDYPQSWGVYLDIQYDNDGNPIQTRIPLVPGGGQQPSDWNPFTNMSPLSSQGGSGISMTIRIPYPNETYGGGQLYHQVFWGHFVTLYQQGHGSVPPRGYWPTDASWWPTFVKFAGPPFG